MISAEVGHSVGVRTMPALVLRAAGIVNPMMRELREMTYEFTAPFILDTSKYEDMFGSGGTPLDVALKATIDWYRGQRIGS